MNDGEMYTIALKHYDLGEFKQCYILLQVLADKCKNVQINAVTANFLLQVYAAFQVINTTMGKENPFIDKLCIEHHSISTELRSHVNKLYCMALLQNKEYKKSKKYMPYIQPFLGPNIKPENMSYFKKNDSNKTLLIYNSGGIGDIIMYSRFIKKICEREPQNNIIFVVNDNLGWMFQDALKISNLKIVCLSIMKVFPQKYDYHTNITMLMYHLNLTYETIYIDYYLENINGNPIDTTNIIESNKRNVIINWCGNKDNSMERYNRSIELMRLIPVFIAYANTVNWICIQKNISPEERDILHQNNVKNYGDVFDNDGDAYKDTVTLLKGVDLVITTDTSLAHLAGTMNIPCWCLLTIGCDWRWTYDKNNWYPTVKTFRQNSLSKWDNVIADVLKELGA